MYFSLSLLLGGFLFLLAGFAYKHSDPESIGTTSLFYMLGIFFILLGYLTVS